MPPSTVAAGFPSFAAAARAVTAVLAERLRPCLFELLDRVTLQSIED
ncbi:MAG: FAD-linked oxidase C-terminal domain-containing protein [Streptosporangiaceae bacterium]